MALTTFVIFIALGLLNSVRSYNASDYNAYLSARQKWEGFGFVNYSIEFSWVLFCCPCKIAQKGLVIQNNNINQVYCLDTSCIENNCSDSSDLNNENYDTIDALFNLILNAFEQNYTGIMVTYDATYGYPSYGKIGETGIIGDVGTGWIISCIYIPNVFDSCGGIFPISSSTNLTALTDYLEAKSLWESYNIVNYRMQIQWSCFCISCYTAEKEIIVKNNTINQVLCTDNVICNNNNCTDFLDPLYYNTIDQLFETILTGIQQNYAQVTVTYNKELGFPQYAYLDQSELIADEEKSWTINCLAAYNSRIHWQHCDGLSKRKGPRRGGHRISGSHNRH